MTRLESVKEYAEDYPVGAMLEWERPPGIRDEPFRAPSARGVVHWHRDDLADSFITRHAIVKFLLDDGYWSKPFELTAGIPCSIWASP